MESDNRYKVFNNVFKQPQLPDSVHFFHFLSFFYPSYMKSNNKQTDCFICVSMKAANKFNRKTNIWIRIWNLENKLRIIRICSGLTISKGQTNIGFCTEQRNQNRLASGAQLHEISGYLREYYK
jgi:hypothetical protein